MEKETTLKYNKRPMGRTKANAENDPFHVDLASLCKAIREEEHCSPAKMAERLHVTIRTYEKWEKGDFEPNAQAVIKLLAIRAKRRGVNLRGILPEFPEREL